MSDSRIMMTGAKETFLVRALVKKVKDAGIDCVFIPWNINDINSAWDGTELVIIYMDIGEMIDEKVLHFLIDKLSENGVQMIPMGEKEDIHYLCDHIPGDMIYKTFTRPIDNGKFINTVTELFEKIEAGDFKKTILIVDDDPNYLGLVREWLKGTYKVAMANSGLQAIKWLGKNKADLILLDYEMPVTSGPQVLEMLRSDEETKNIPVIFLTGKGDKESVMAVLSLKPDGYFLKSITKEDLMGKLADHFILHK